MFVLGLLDQCLCWDYWVDANACCFCIANQFEQQKSEINLAIRKKQYDNLPDEVKRLFTIVKYGKDKVSTYLLAPPSSCHYPPRRGTLPDGGWGG